MELDKLKEIWTSLDNRMQQQEVLKTTLIKEMLVNKSDKALNRLINYSYFGFILVLIIIPPMILLWQLHSVLNNIFIPIIFVLLPFSIITGIIQLINLHKIKLSNPINQNIYLVQKTNIFNKRASFISYILIALLIVPIVVITLNTSYTIESWRWVVVITTILVGVICGIWEYKCMYRRNFNSILKSLEELKDLEETEKSTK